MPRKCGIATFTADLARTLSDLDPGLDIDCIAMSDKDGYAYPDMVCSEIVESDQPSYTAAAEYINRFGYDVLSIQHEYGIFGGDAGSHLMNLVRQANMPVVTTLHTVLREPTPAQKRVMDELLQLSERVVVMSKKAVGFLKDVHDVPHDKVDLIPHGVPYIPESAGKRLREDLKIEGPMILTFGLLSPDKGIQYVIEAMPKIVKEHPGATYMVVGATHPSVLASAGEVYRESLVDLAKNLGVESNVRFVDRFVTLEELVEYLSAMDIYATPSLNPNQITSGTLAYAIGAGKAVISTPYWYAKDVLAEGRGLLVPFRDAEAISEAVLAIHRDPLARQEMGRKAAEYGKHMLWPEVGKKYLDSFARAKYDSASRLRDLVQLPVAPLDSGVELPPFQFDHLLGMTDDTGVLQHATLTTPLRSEGYCVDDNARALLFTALMETVGSLQSDLVRLQGTCLSFVLHAFNARNGRFRNFMSYRREWLENAGSEDSHGRSFWALGAMVNRCTDRNRREVAKDLFESAAPALFDTTSPRTWAYGVIGASECLQAYPHESSTYVLLQTLANRLLRQYEATKSAEWPWFEQSLSYANARLPQALIIAGNATGDQDMLEAGLDSLTWLMELQTGENAVFVPVGTNGLFSKSAERIYFDQQPIEASSSLSACLSAHRATARHAWLDEAHRAFGWFLGKNQLGRHLYDKATGGCHDGLHAERVNGNQGAESTLSFLCALAELRDADALAVFHGDRIETNEDRTVSGAS